MKTKRYCYAHNLKDNAKLIAAYKIDHAKGKAWPEIIKCSKDAGSYGHANLLSMKPHVHDYGSR